MPALLVLLFGGGFTAVIAGVSLAVAAIFTAEQYDSYTDEVSDMSALLARLPQGGSRVYDRHGQLLYEWADAGVRRAVPLSEISPWMIKATIATEDSTFWTNNGLNVRGLSRAAIENFAPVGERGLLEGTGGSSITQQLAKNVYIEPEERMERSIGRKVRETALALELTQRYSKEQILEWYLNSISYGGIYVGVESAAQGYFGKSASELTIGEAALLAGIPQRPASYEPVNNPERARARAEQVLQLMVHHGLATPEDIAGAGIGEIQAHAYQAEALAPHFVFGPMADWIHQRFGPKALAQGGLEIRTTLDLELQREAERILEENLKKWGDGVGAHNGALVSMDARSGEILLMVGSRNYYDESPTIQGKNNFATAILQPGSAFKPFVYLSLFEQKGYGPDSIIWDAPFTTHDGYKCENPRKARNVGPVPIELALGSSMNCPANRAAATAGVTNVLKLGERFGLTTLGDPSNYGPAVATGGANITLLDMTYAYTTLARNGNMIGLPREDNADIRSLDPITVLEVKDSFGKVIFKAEPETKQVIEPGYPYLISSILSDCQQRRLIWACGFPLFQLSDKRPVASKTGTQQGEKTEETRANWQFIYTPDIVTGGWVGNGDRRTWTDVNGGANAVGFSVQQLLDLIVQRYEVPPSEFQRPPQVVTVNVRQPDGSRGLLGGCGPIVPGLFVKGREPDSNNRICVNGSIRVPPEQVGTGGLPASGFFLSTPTPTRPTQPGTPDAPPPSEPGTAGAPPPPPPPAAPTPPPPVFIFPNVPTVVPQQPR